MSVIDCLSAGFRYLGWRLELLLIPVALDLLLWLAPQFSIAPLAGRLAAWYREMGVVGGMPADATTMAQQIADSVESVGATFNLLSALVSTTLLHVPSLLVTGAQASPLPDIELSTTVEALVLWLVFSLLGLLIGVVYLVMLASRLPIGAMAGRRGTALAGNVFRQWLQVIAFVLIVSVVLMAIYIPLSIAVGIVTLVSPPLASFIALASGSLTLILFFYLFFSTAGIVMDNLSAPSAMRRSVQVVRNNFMATLGFAALSTLIAWGISLLLTQLASVALWTVTPAIILNAYIGTGLAMALLVFYRTRYLSSDAALFE